MTHPTRTFPQLVACLALALSSSGCASVLDGIEGSLASTGAFDFGPASGTIERDGGVAVQGAGGPGRGAIVGARKVLTVQHVVGSASSVDVAVGYTWATARVVRTIPAFPEPLVELELAADDAVDPDRVLATGAGPAVWVLCADGARAWGHTLRPGDSGSPVVDAAGAVVGLAVGNQGGLPLLASAREGRGTEVASLR